MLKKIQNFILSVLFLGILIIVAEQQGKKNMIKQKESIQPFGQWNSPITPELITKGLKVFSNLSIDEQDIYWTELRPSEEGRNVIVKKGSDGQNIVITPKEYNVRTRVHEYGGTPYTVKNGNIYFVNFNDQRLYHQSVNGDIKAITEHPSPRFAEMEITEHGIFAVAELHENDSVINFIALIDPEAGTYETIDSGADFYASPKFHSPTQQLTWVSWNHPNMPWDTTELWVADFKESKITNKHRVAGGENTSVINPKWSPEGVLHYVSDSNGWWNIYRDIDGKSENIYEIEAEFGAPLWVLGQSTYAFYETSVIALHQKNGITKASLIDSKTLSVSDIELQGTSSAHIQSNNDFFVTLEASATVSPRILKYTPDTQESEILVQNENHGIDPGYISTPEHISFPTSEGQIAYGYYYPPTNKDYTAPEGFLPPLIVKSHGGPTSKAGNTLSMSYQYWTSRGFAILDVDYRGSSGYGREYRSLLKNSWGEFDRDDVENGALHLVKKGLVDSKRLAITGGSAGGYTTLNALTFGDVFTVGASYYGVSDLELLGKETHKFESRYLDGLIGPYPESKHRYRVLSPIYFTEKIAVPIIFFQGAEDKIVLPNQAELMYEALKNKGILTSLIIYDGEQHGFRQAKNIENSLEKELEFYLEAWKSNNS
ncbi:MAG: prolyl oligopeptidase family serine peptidase [Chlamydiota bacterium]|nr:prolyl oligopeptidase family serine peptidase [Chlamydiota bacterium]